jgi:uncharacterized membrane protein
LKQAATVALSVLLVSAVPSAAPKTWAISQVFEGQLIAITNSGRLIGQLREGEEPNQVDRPFLGRLGSLVYLPFTPVDVNDPGQVVGSLADGRPVVWKHGTTFSLPTVPGYPWALPSAINNVGQVVGRVTRWVAGVEQSVGVLWSHGSAVTLDGMSRAYDINDNGQVVGVSPDRHAVLWEAGTLTRLPQPRADGTSAAMAINNRGEAVGYSTWGPGSTTYPAVLWYRGTVTELQLPPSWPSAAYATGINGRGQVVGYIWSPGLITPALWEDGVLTELPIWSSTEGVWAVGINNRGDIIGTSIDYGAEVGVIWTRRGTRGRPDSE